MKQGWFVLAAALGACSGPPLVDMTDIDPVVFQRDLDSCEAYGQATDTAGPLIVGAIMGASIGAGLGSGVGVFAGANQASAEAYGAVGGAAAGAGATAASGEPLATPPAAPRQTVRQCLEAHGYKPIAPPGT
jgi:hypothetical protein